MPSPALAIAHDQLREKITSMTIDEGGENSWGGWWDILIGRYAIERLEEVRRSHAGAVGSGWVSRINIFPVLSGISDVGVVRAFSLAEDSFKIRKMSLSQ